MAKLDIVGERYGKLVVIRFEKTLTNINNKSKRQGWLCKCDCGNETIVSTSNLRNKRQNTKSCGCAKKQRGKRYNSVDILGKKFNLLTVTKRTDEFTKTRGVIWECICDCGKIVKLPTNSIISGNTKSCGDKKHQASPRYGVIPLAHINHIKQNAIKRNLLFEVSLEYLDDLFKKQNSICALSGIELVFTKSGNAYTGRVETTASLDRIDNTKGYIDGNVRWVHKDINKMRSNHTDTKFIEYCRLCVEYAKQHSS